MDFDVIQFGYHLINRQAADQILKCNEFTAKYGLTLTPKQAMNLVETRCRSLKDNGRIEFGPGIIDKIIKEFCDSPFINQDNYEETLEELIRIFYYYKNETLDKLSDDELIKYMKKAFDGPCQGSLELLSDSELDRLARNVRYGFPLDYVAETEEIEETEEADNGDEHVRD